MSKKNRSPRFRDLSELLIGIACVLLMLFIGSFTVLRADLTSEKRYTLKPATEEVVKGLDDVVFVKVYLSGDLPADLRQLAQSFRELLDELRIRQPELLQYEFVDPNASPDEKTRREMYADLQKKGLQYTSVRIKDKGAYGERIVFPGAIITYKDKSLPVQLLKTQLRQPDAEMVNRSINNLEYELASAIRQVTARRKPRIAFLEGHGELDELSVKDISNALSEQYEVSRVRIDQQLAALSEKTEGMAYRANTYDALIIARPDSAIPERDRYVIDQFVMNGGKVLWCIDAMNANLDSLRTNQFSMATPLDLGLDRMLFGYGVRINKDLLLDRSCAPIEIYTTPYGNQPKLERFPWYFEPVLIPQNSHPIVNNIDPVHTAFVSSMDTIAVDSVKKTILLTTSPYTRLLRNPVRISLNIVEMDMGLEKSGTPSLPVAVLLEGRFTSAFADQLMVTPEVRKEWGYRERSLPTAQLVISDGDAIANRVDRKQGMFYTLGYDRYAKSKIYGNRELFVNAMNYLLDDRSLISIRSQAISLRQLDPQRSIDERTRWQVVNLAGPVLLALLGVLAFALLRKKRYATAA